MSDFVLWEVLGTFPSLANLFLAIEPDSHPAHAPEISISQSGGPRYFDALESLCVRGSFFLIQHLLGFIDSSSLKSIEVGPVISRVRNEHEPEDHFTPSLTIVTSKCQWSQSLENLNLDIDSLIVHQHPTSALLLLTDLHVLQTFCLGGWRMENVDDDVRRLVMSWPKLRTLKLPLADDQFISLSTLRIVAENCPELRHLDIQLDTSTIPSFDASTKSLCHNLQVLTVGKALLLLKHRWNVRFK